MQFLMIALCLTGFSEDGNLNSAGISDWSPVDASITFNVINTWTITWANNVLGLTTWENGSDVYILYSESSTEIGSLDPNTGGTAGSVPKPAGAGMGFGIVFNDNITTPLWHINSWSPGYVNLWYTEDFDTWQSIANPAGTTGRGMTYDGDYYWQGSTTSLVRFQHGGSGQAFTNLAPSQISGVAYVPGDNPAYDYFMITTFNTDIFVLYFYNGVNLTQVATGTTPTGLGNTNRLGLTYSFDRGSLFLAYSISDGYAISEMVFDTVSLSRDTWAGIKSSF